MFVNKGKINTSRFYSILHHEESPEKPQYGNTSSPISRQPPSSCLNMMLDILKNNFLERNAVSLVLQQVLN